ncbi:MAG: DUF1552 domain-containing protein [Lentisphaeraceae bacterium]|nr:DUF1552 domain-containing protein [Lentisphaeraceae bacterium]
MAKLNLTRRTVLQGIGGVSLSMPWLEATAEAKKQTKAPINTAFLFMPNGVNPKMWTPEGEGKNYKLSEILKPLEAMKNEFDVLTHLGHKQAKHGDGHYAKTANYLSGELVHKTSGKNIRSGKSCDQIIAQRVGNNSPLPSIELGIEATRTGVDTNVGFTQVYGGHISWSDSTTPVPKEIYPQLAFDRLFSKNNLNTKLASVLDAVKDDVKRLNDSLGTEDKVRMDEFYTSVRALEKRIQRSIKNVKAPELDPQKHKRPDGGLPKSLQEHMTLMLDLMILAFQMNRTHVATFMFGNSVSGKNFSFLDGVEGGFHQLSHHANNKEKLKMYGKINVFHMVLFNNFLRKMKSIKQGDQTLLDNSLVMIGSGLRDGNKHEPINLPTLIAGGAGRGITRGQHRVFKKDTPMCNLLLGMMQESGIESNKFGDSTGVIV